MGPRIQIKHGRQTAEEKKLEAKYDLLRKKKELKLAKKMVKDAEKKAKTEFGFAKRVERHGKKNSWCIISDASPVRFPILDALASAHVVQI